MLNRMDESIHILQKTDSDESVLFLLDRWLGEMNLRLAHVFAGGHGDTTLLGLIDGAVEMIDHTIVLYDEALMGEEAVELLAGLDKIGTFPVVPVHKILRASEGVVSLVFAGRIEGAEVEHGVKTLRTLTFEIRRVVEHHAILDIHLLNLCIARDDALALVGEDGVAGITLPDAHIVAGGYADALSLVVGLGIDAACIVEHHEIGAQALVLVEIDHRLVLNELLEPLAVGVALGNDGSIQRFPFMGGGNVAFGPCQSDVKRSANALIARASTAKIGHPMTSIVFLKAIRACPVPIEQRWEAASLIGIPAQTIDIWIGIDIGGFVIEVLANEAEHAAQGLPMQQVGTFGQPRLVATSILSALSIIYDIGHIPLVALTIDSGAIDLVLVVGGRNDQAILEWCQTGLENRQHLLLRNYVGRSGG